MAVLLPVSISPVVMFWSAWRVISSPDILKPGEDFVSIDPEALVMVIAPPAIVPTVIFWAASRVTAPPVPEFEELLIPPLTKPLLLVVVAVVSIDPLRLVISTDPALTEEMVPLLEVEDAVLIPPV